MKIPTEELEDLMRVAEVNSKRREKIRVDFQGWNTNKQNKFLDDFRWEIIRTTNKNNYNDMITQNNPLIWDLIDGCWEAQSAACYEPGDHMTWRFKQNSDGLWIDDSSEELRIDAVQRAVFMSPIEAKAAYQKWENEMIESFTVEKS